VANVVVPPTGFEPSVALNRIHRCTSFA
jgi:hypothetical protein